MVKKTINKNIIDTVKKFRAAIETAGIPVEKMILFGSYAKGTARTNSDIDIAVVSKNFGYDDVDEMQLLWKETHLVDSRIEPYPLSPRDLREGFSPIAYEIKKYGILV
jgi:predicted nucleotidyltransferase